MNEVLDLVARLAGTTRWSIRRGRAQPGDVRRTGADTDPRPGAVGLAPQVGLADGLAPSWPGCATPSGAPGRTGPEAERVGRRMSA